MESGLFISITAVAVALCGGLAWVAFWTPIEVLTLALTGVLPEPIKTEGKANDGNGGTDTTSTKQYPARPHRALPAQQAAMNPDGPERQNERSERQESEAKAKKPRERPKWTDIALVVFGACAVAVAYFQAGTSAESIRKAEEANRLARDALEATKISANATKEYAEQSREANKIARETQHIQLRAYVAVGTTTLIYNEQTMTFSGMVELRNTGQTPANSFNGTACMLLMPSTFVGPFNLCPYDKAVKVTLPSSGGRALPATMVVAPEDVQEIKSGRKVAWLFGEVHYTDVFNVEHFTRFRVNQIPGRGFANGSIEIAFPLDGNDSD